MTVKTFVSLFLIVGLVYLVERVHCDTNLDVGKGNPNKATNKFPFLALVSKKDISDFFNIRKNNDLSKKDVKEREAQWAANQGSKVKDAFDEYTAKHQQEKDAFTAKLNKAAITLSSEAREVFDRIESLKGNMDITHKEEQKAVHRILNKASKAIRDELKQKIPRQQHGKPSSPTHQQDQPKSKEVKNYGIDPNLVTEYLNIRKTSTKTKAEIKREQSEFVAKQDSPTQSKFLLHLADVDRQKAAKQQQELTKYAKLTPEAQKVFDVIKEAIADDTITYAEEKTKIKSALDNATPSVRHQLKTMKKNN
uniref:DUF148 domain-containing protein n=1 Tax=Rhabditophanes sp. KR3021 TaxID=114890 RepID=A0AC35UA01_9BILA